MAKSTGLVNTTKFDGNIVYTPKMSTVYVPWAWNCRYGESSGNELTEETGFKGLVQNIAAKAAEKSTADGSDIAVWHGQDTPVTLRPNPYYGKKGHAGSAYLYMVVSGFQRAKAIAGIANGEQDVTLGAAGLDQAQVTRMHCKDPMIRAFIRNMTEIEARKENLGENMLRATLSAPDIAFGVAELRKVMPEGTTAEQVAREIGRSQQYTSKLFRIYQGLEGVVLPPGSLSKDQTAPINVLDAWRKGTGLKATNEDLLTVAEAKGADGATLSTSEKAAAYLAVVKPAVEKVKKKQGPGAWVANAATDAEAFGVLLGNLQRDGAIEVLQLEAKHCPTIAAKYAAKMVGDKFTEDMADQIATACDTGIRKGMKKAPKAAAPAPESETSKKEKAIVAAGDEKRLAAVNAKKKNGKASASA